MTTTLCDWSIMCDSYRARSIDVVPSTDCCTDDGSIVGAAWPIDSTDWTIAHDTYSPIHIILKGLNVKCKCKRCEEIGFQPSWKHKDIKIRLSKYT